MIAATAATTMIVHFTHSAELQAATWLALSAFVVFVFGIKEMMEP